VSVPTDSPGGVEPVEGSWRVGTEDSTASLAGPFLASVCPSATWGLERTFSKGPESLVGQAPLGREATGSVLRLLHP
jgi:hypothetical protein